MESIGFRIIGTVKGFQRDNETGLILPETLFEDKNTLYATGAHYLAYKIGTDTINQAIDNRFTTGAALVSGDEEYDGIAYGPTSSTLSHKLDTDINAGGDQATNYIEFSGSIAGPIGLAGVLALGFDYTHGSTAFANLYATYGISVTVDPGRTFYFYWRLTLS